MLIRGGHWTGVMPQGNGLDLGREEASVLLTLGKQSGPVEENLVGKLATNMELIRSRPRVYYSGWGKG